MAISTFGYDYGSVGQQPGPGGWWPGAAGRSAAAQPGPIGGIDYGPSSSADSGQIGQIDDLINSLNRNAQTKALQARIPQAPTLEAQSSSNIAKELQGQLPSDVTALLAQQAAEAGVASGAPGSPAAQSAYIRALGLSSLDLEQAGQRDLSAAYARNPAAPLYDPSGQLITPYQSAQLRLQAESIADRGGGGGGVPSTRGGSPGYGAYTPPSGDIAYSSTASDPLGPVTTPFDWVSATFAPGNYPAGTPGRGYYYAGDVPTQTSTLPPGSTAGTYVDPATLQTYDASTGSPFDFSNPAPLGTNLFPAPNAQNDLDYSAVFPGSPGP